MKKKTKKLNLKLILISALIGLLISIPIYLITGFTELSICPPELSEQQTASSGVSICKIRESKNISEGQAISGTFCKEGKLHTYSIKTCIRKYLFFLIFPIIKKLPSDTGLLIFYLVMIYGAFAGAIIGCLINLTLVKKK